MVAFRRISCVIIAHISSNFLNLSIIAVNGTQADIKGVYPTGSVYFNPPGSGHSVWDSSGFFLLAYASPPDFVNTNLIEEYDPVIIDTSETGNKSEISTLVADNGHLEYEVPLDESGGMSAAFMERLSTPHTYEGNYILVLAGPCIFNGKEYGEQKLIVAKGIPTISFELEGSECKVMGVAFTTSIDSTDGGSSCVTHGAKLFGVTLALAFAMLLA